MPTHRNPQHNKPAHEPRTRKEQHLAREEAKQKKILLIAAIVVGAVVLAVLLIGLIDAIFVTPNKVIASVGDEKITVTEYKVRARYYRWMMLNEVIQINQIMSYFGDYDGNQQTRVNTILSSLADPASIAPEVVDLMIQDIIIEQKAAELGITVSDEEIAAAIQEGFGFYANGTPTPEPVSPTFPAPTMDDIQSLLITATPDFTATPEVTNTPEATPTQAEPTATTEPTATPEGEEAASTPTVVPTPTEYTIDVYNDNYADYVDKISLAKVSEADLREILRLNILREKVMAELTKDVKAEEEQVWARHILTSDEAGALSAYGQLESGAMDFAQLAMMLSIDSGSAEQGGDLGWFGRGQMVQEFEDAVFSLTEVGDIYAPVVTEYGYHVIQLLGRANMPVDNERWAALKQSYFTQWLTDTQTAMADQITINETLRDKYAPSEPSFNDPKIYEALWGIKPAQAAKTSAAVKTEAAVLTQSVEQLLLTPSATAEPTK